MRENQDDIAYKSKSLEREILHPKANIAFNGPEGISGTNALASKSQMFTCGEVQECRSTNHKGSCERVQLRG